MRGGFWYETEVDGKVILKLSVNASDGSADWIRLKGR